MPNNDTLVFGVMKSKIYKMLFLIVISTLIALFGMPKVSAYYKKITSTTVPFSTQSYSLTYSLDNTIYPSGNNSAIVNLTINNPNSYNVTYTLSFSNSTPTYTIDGAAPTTYTVNAGSSKTNTISINGETGTSITITITATTPYSQTHTQVVNFDNVNPTVNNIEGGTTLKQTSPSLTLKCSDLTGVTGYYWGTTEPTSVSDITNTTSADITALASSSGLSKTVSSAGTYWFACKNAVGNYDKKSITLYSYQVINMFQNVEGDTHITMNYTQSSTGTYLAKSGTTLTLASIGTTPTGSNTNKIDGVSTGAPSEDPATLSSTAPTLSANSVYTIWYRRNEVHFYYKPNGGTMVPTTHTTDGETTYTWSTDGNGYITRNGSIYQTKYRYRSSNESLTVNLANYNSSANLFIYKMGYLTASGANWLCESGCATSGATFTQGDIALTGTSSLCDASSDDCTIVVKVNWNKQTHSLSYDYDGGSVSSANPTSYNIDSSEITLTNPTRTGYTFSGWTEVIHSLTWYAGAINTTTGNPEWSLDYPEAYFTNFIKLKSGKTYTISEYDEYNDSLIRWEVYNTSGTYTGTGSTTTTYTPSSDCYVRIVFLDASTSTQRGDAIVSASIGTTGKVLAGSNQSMQFVASLPGNQYRVFYAGIGATTAYGSNVRFKYDGLYHSGNTVLDMSNKSVNATATDVSFASSGYMTFNGTSSVVKAGVWNSDYMAIEIIFSMQEAQTSGSAQYVFTNIQDGGGAIRITTGETIQGGFYFDGTLRWLSGPTVTYGKKYHVAVTFDGTTMALYINGSLYTSTTAYSGKVIDPAVNNTIWAIGGNPNGTNISGQYFKGRVYSAALWGSTRLAANVASDSGKNVTYGSTYGSLPTPARAGYSFDEWHQSSPTGTVIDSNTPVTTASDHTIFASWSQVPTLSISGGTTLKATSQTLTLKCSDNTSVSAYYWGKTEPTSASNVTSTNSSNLTSLQSEDGWTRTVSEEGNWWLACKDTDGNYSKKKIIIRKYQVQSVIDKVAGTIGTYTSANYGTTGSLYTYYIKDGRTLTLTSIYTIPSASVAGNFKGYTTSAPSSTAQSPSKTNPTISNDTTTYYMWFNRKSYSIVFNKNGGSGSMSSVSFKHGQSITLPANEFTKSNNLFMFWSTSSSTVPLIFDTEERSGTAPSNANKDFKEYRDAATPHVNQKYGLIVDVKGSGEMHNYLFATNSSSFLQTSLTTNSQGYTSTGKDGHTAITTTSTYQTVTVEYTFASSPTTSESKVLMFRLLAGQSGSIKNVRFFRKAGSESIYFDEQTITSMESTGTVTLYATWYQYYVPGGGGGQQIDPEHPCQGYCYCSSGTMIGNYCYSGARGGTTGYDCTMNGGIWAGGQCYATRSSTTCEWDCG